MIRTNPMSAAGRRYLTRFMPLMVAYVAVLMGCIWTIRFQAPTGPLLWLLAVAPALPLVGCIVVMGLYLTEEKDELPRVILVESMLWGIGLTLAATTIWGFLENADVVPHFPTYLTFPIFCGAMGISQAFVSRRYR